MDTTILKKFSQGARRQLLEQVAARLEQVLSSDSVEIREKAKAVAELKAQIKGTSKKAVIDRVAYTWFNRFCALRFMDANHYTHIGVVSPAEGGTQPEILLEAKQGHIDDELARYVNRQMVFDLLSGKRRSSDAQQEAYRLLIVGICNYYNAVMPFMFEKIEDYTELLMPLDLLSENSVLHDLREAMTPDSCQDVEVIGWLYQYYISERKDEVFEALKQNQKIEAEDIPAATQLFTPHWIVRYLVENSLGRLWMLNHPNSRLIDRMEYYIKPAQEETDFLRITNPEELRLLDPACGSGHILTYALDLLYAIYEEEGYASNDIPRLILERNIFGVEIDGRAGALAAFALTMKARAKDRRFFSRGVLPNICVLENVTFNDAELRQYMNAVGRDLFPEPLKATLLQFEQVESFGSLIRPLLKDASYMRTKLASKNVEGNLFLHGVHERVLHVLKFAEFLAPPYHVVVGNPPYMGYKGMNLELKNFSKDHYPDSYTDAYGMFMERGLDLICQYGYVGMITIPNWMFISSFEDHRANLLSQSIITSLIHIGRGVWGSDFGSCAFVLKKEINTSFKGLFKRLYIKQGEVNSNDELNRRFLDNSIRLFQASLDDFRIVPGIPIAYWISQEMRNIFLRYPRMDSVVDARQGLITGHNERFLRYWFEVAFHKIGVNIGSRDDAKKSRRKWFPYNKGGDFRRWYGNQVYIVNWENDGKEIRSFIDSNGELRSRPQNLDFYFKESISWSDITISTTAFRYYPKGFIFDSTGLSAFPHSPYSKSQLLSLGNNIFTSNVIKFLNPTVHFNVGNFDTLPAAFLSEKQISGKIQELIRKSKEDWDSFETSWDFGQNPILSKINHQDKLEEAYKFLSQYWQALIQRFRQLEEENNRLFINTNNFQHELTSEVPIEEITLTRNPFYRYGNNKNSEALEELLCADTMKEFISYSVGCMFGRYSLDKPGLILANQGETVRDYLKQVRKPTFEPDEDNVVPVLEGEWFNDDIAERFKEFLRVIFGEEHYEENLTFIEEAIGRDIRSYFVKEFYKEHVQMYKKRPIYWMFSSPKGSFNALIYLHRYQPDTVSIVLNDYLREYVKKLQAHKSHLEAVSVSTSATQSQKTKALREIARVNKTLAELRGYEDKVLYPLANEKIKINLDDGVKVNYAKFGSALASIPGL